MFMVYAVIKYWMPEPTMVCKQSLHFNGLLLLKSRHFTIINDETMIAIISSCTESLISKSRFIWRYIHKHINLHACMLIFIILADNERTITLENKRGM